MPPSIPVVIFTHGPPTPVVLLCHWYVGVGVPVALAAKIVFAPLHIVLFVGLVVIVGGVDAVFTVPSTSIYCTWNVPELKAGAKG